MVMENMVVILTSGVFQGVNISMGVKIEKFIKCERE